MIQHSGIWIPIEVLHDKNLTHTERYLLMDIVSLDKLNKGCIASNEYFSELLDMSKTNISRSLHKLEEKGYIKIEIEPGSRNHNRVIKMIFKGYQNDILGLSKREETKETKSITKSEILEYVDYWNALCEHSTLSPVRSVSKKRGEKVIQRIRESENFMDDFELVIYAIQESDFLLGDNDQGWKVSFDWIFHNDTNYLKILEGNYKNTPKTFKGKEPEVGSIAWRMKQEQEVIDVSA